MFTDPESTHSQLSKNVCHAYGSYHESSHETSPKKTLLVFQPLDFPPQMVYLVASLASCLFRLLFPHPPSPLPFTLSIYEYLAFLDLCPLILPPPLYLS